MSKYRIIEDDKNKKTDSKSVKEQKKSTKTPKKAKEKVGFIRRMKETFAELKNVTWLNFKTILSRTGVVLAFCAISLVILLVIDLLLKGFVGLLGIS